MGSMIGFKYNGAIDRVDIKPNTEYRVDGDLGYLKVHNLFDKIPEEYMKADYIVVDPPWNAGNLKSFYTKARLELDKEFSDFINRIFYIIKKTKVNACYMEFGNQFKDIIAEMMGEVFDNVRVIDSFYYNTKPCVFVIGENNGYELELEHDPKDELKVIDEIIKKKEGTVLDFCLGRGAVSRTAYKYHKKFIGTELNINRLAVSMEDLIKKGAKVEEVKKA